MPTTLSCTCGETVEVPDTHDKPTIFCLSCFRELNLPSSTSPETQIQANPSEPLYRISPDLISVDDPDDDEEDPEDPEDEEQIQTEYYCSKKGEPDFFCDPPAEIGPLISAHTTLLKSENPISLIKKLSLSLLITIVVGVLLYILVVSAISRQNADILHHTPLGLLILGVCFATLFGFVNAFTFDYMVFEHTCAYVGTEGCAYFSCARERSNVVAHGSFLFHQAADLHVLETHHYLNGNYTQTHYVYSWHDEDREYLMGYSAWHRSYNNLPGRRNMYHFVKKAEEIWSIYLLEDILTKVENGGAHSFHLSQDSHIVLYLTYMELHHKGKVQEYHPEDIANIRIQNGVVSLREPGARSGWFTESGIYKFNFSEISNARVFLLLMNTLFKIPIQ